MAAGLLDRLVETGEVVDLGDAHRGTAAGGLDEEREAVLAGELHDALAGGGTVVVPLTGAHHLVRADGQSEGGEHPLHVLLVLTDGRGQDTGAHVRHSGELQEALERAVLAVGAVQHREDDVDLAEGFGDRARFGVDDFAASGVDGEHHTTLVGLRELVHVRHLAVRDGHACGVVGGERPAAVRRDADRQDVVLGPVDGLHDGAGRDDRDAVLGASAAEHDGHPRLAALHRALGALRALGEVLAAHIAMSVPCRPGGEECRHSVREARRERISAARAWRCATSAP